MYEEWPSIESEVLNTVKDRSVLYNYPANVAEDVANSIVSSFTLNGQPFGHNVMSRQDTTEMNCPQLLNDTQVKWTMEVICYGLCLSDFETLKNSTNIYLDWLTVVSAKPHPSIPKPLHDEPLPYVRKIISHLQNLFVSRNESQNNNQLALCQNVLKAIQSLAHDNDDLDRPTWETILMFILRVSNTLLAPPSQPNSLAEQMCEQLMQAFFDIWMLSCHKCFPTPSLWKTSRDLMSGWRHHPSVVDWWGRISAALTSRLLMFMYGPDFPPYKVSEVDMQYVPKQMNNETVAQTWFRTLHMISDPVELSNSAAVTKSQIFNELTTDPCHHPCLRMLPYIFLKAMKGVSSLVDAFLGLSNEKKYEITYPSTLMQIATPITPTNTRKSAKAKKGLTGGPKIPSSPNPNSSSTMSPGSSISSSTPPSGANNFTRHAIDMHPHPTSLRPQCNSILNLFGEWLFGAALVGCKFDGKNESRSRSSSIPYPVSSSLTTPSDNLISNPMFDVSDYPDSSEAGRAEACGTLCRLFSCKKAGEHILPTYLARFYLVLNQGLLSESKQVLASILLNSVDLLRIDLPGVTCLVPAILNALELILPDKELQQFKPYLNVVELRRSSLHLLISMLPLPLHYTSLQIEDIQELWASSGATSNPSFISLKKRLLDLLIGALQCESDPTNTQMILGALLLSIHDSALFEASEEMTTPQQPNESKGVLVETAYGLYVQIIHLVSQKLESWKSDVGITLAALELLSGLAKADIKMSDRQECRRAVHKLCQYIVYQSQRPPQQHKRELHSMIVTAFHTLAEWLMKHSYLLNDKDCLIEVLEIVELGISGSKSKADSTGSNKNEPVLKSVKEINPVSQRVREAAEELLILIFEQLGGFPSMTSPSMTCSLLDERSLVLYASGTRCTSADNDLPTEKAVQSFKYFGLSNGTMLSVLSQQLGNEPDPAPTVTFLLRSPSGKKAWTMQLQQTPRCDKLSLDDYLFRPERPLPADQRTANSRPTYRTFPEEVHRIPMVNADYSIPPLKDIPDPEQAVHVETIKEFIKLQMKYDEDIASDKMRNSEVMAECSPHEACHDFKSCRLFLSHLNLLTLDSVKPQKNSGLGPDLVMLNANDLSFVNELDALDCLPTRNHDTVFVFYVKEGQTTREEILANVSGDSSLVAASFTEFLLSLGWPVNVVNHPGWTGRLQDSWELKYPTCGQKNETVDLNRHGPSIFDGEKHILYFANASTEVAFIVPGLQQNNSNTDISSEGGLADDGRDKFTLDLDIQSAPPSVISQESPTSPTGSTGSKRKKLGPSSRPASHTLPDAVVAIVWCESYDSFHDFCIDKLKSEMLTGHESVMTSANRSKEATVILIHPLESGLFRVKVQGQNTTKGGVTTPLISGMVVSRRVLGTATRLTAMNACNRKRLSSDAYNPPHTRRKQKMKEIFSKYQKRCTEPDFYTAVFTDCKKEEFSASSYSESTTSSSSLHSVVKPLVQAS